MSIKKYFFALSLSLLMFSCKEDIETNSGVSLSQEELSFYADGGFVEVELSAAGAWVARSNQPWCLVSPANGTGSDVVRIQADYSSRYDGREATIQFVCGSDIKEVKISQMGYAPTIKVTEKPEENLPYYNDEEKSYFDVEVEGNVKFDVKIPLAEGNVEWVKMEEGKDKDYVYVPSETRPEKKTFRFRYDINAAPNVREQIIEFVQNGVLEGKEPVRTECTIKQDCMEDVPSSRRGDSLAVVTLAKLMNVFGTSWDASRPITHWDNVITKYIDDTDDGKDNGELRIVGLSLVMFETDRSVPFVITKLDKLESLQLRANSNAYLKSIKLGDEITELKNLRSLSLYSYGISQLPAPDKMAKMTSLEELNLYGNTFMELGSFSTEGTLLHSLKNLVGQLRYLDVSGNRRYDGVKDLKDIPFLPYLKQIEGYKDYEQIGMSRGISTDLLKFEKLEYLALSNNYLTGNIADWKDENIPNPLPKLRTIKINQNLLHGTCPAWMTKHDMRGCWDTEVLIKNQIFGGKDIEGEPAGLTGTFTPIIECPEPGSEETDKALSLPQLSKFEKEAELLPMGGYWRYYENFNLLK